ncbi:CUAEP/CCAEP-tail radical SAM (seleno)protein [Inmirania thermothiophila]|uniref:Radical SAM superfamily enzyme YgiQ (UPF0313 family) n=1 Tax=Inmirania thermothiophila TaxID=1750597 RepID=A0A3N1YBF2_9GAMM|nr:CUAEP/CCAEP-tail radical SAM protein [Inmirania thermothiophila]ROR34982.1 radical SAM superfamily enzyme YgiQ (UPF0313 family) [Inmirania thermothiophila]
MSDHPACCAAAPGTARGAVRVVLVSPYEIGRQPFALAEPAAWLREAGFDVRCLDLAVEPLSAETLSGARLVALYLGMHTATRIAARALPRIRELAPEAHLCAYGLYAPMNAAWLQAQGVGTILGGEVEPALLALAEAVRDGTPPPTGSRVHLGRVRFLRPARELLPALRRYARLRMPDGSERVVAFAEATRGCKHLCRHCPVVPVYHGRFRTVPVEVVLEDIAQQVEAGAEHVSFGDPDFLNGPAHALRVVRALAARFPGITYDAVIKIEHLLKHAALLPELARTGCLFVTAAVESVDDRVLARLAKGHTAGDFRRAVALLRDHGIGLAPTFIPFTPWTTLAGYRELLATVSELGLVRATAPVQLAIRLLVPEGSLLLELPGFRERLEPFDPRMLGYPWRHTDPRVDALQAAVQRRVAEGEAAGRGREAIFAELWELAHEALGRAAPPLDEAAFSEPVPAMTEPWYCCAEPTEEQLSGF